MRTTTVGNFVITFPEGVIWLYDSNVIAIENVAGHKVGAVITVTHPNGVTTKTIRYFSQVSNITYTITDVLYELFDDNLGQYGCYIELYNNGLYAGSFSFSFQLLAGKSFTNRSHAVETVMYIYNPDELIKFQLYSPANGIVTVGGYNYNVVEGLNQLNLTQPIYQEGTYSLCLGSSSTFPTTTIAHIEPYAHRAEIDLVFGTGSAGSAKDGGDVWTGAKEIFPICHTIIYEGHCDDFDFFEVSYTNVDGCRRYIAGKLIDETNNSEFTPYHRLRNDVFANIPLASVSGHNRKVKVAFSDVNYNAYLSDILLSQTIWYRNYEGEWKECRLSTDKLSNTTKESEDFTLEFIISEY